MTSQIASIIRELEQRKATLEKAIKALMEIDGASTEPASASIEKPPSTRKGKKRSAATRKRMRDAQRKRWAHLKGEVPF